MKRIVIMAAAWAAFLCPAHAQIPGQFPAGAIYGNPGGAQAPPRAALPGDFGIQLAAVTTPVAITPTTPIAASSSWTSPCFPSTGNDRIDFAATLSGAGTLKINRYLTVTAGACSNAIPGGPVSRTASAATPQIVSASDGAAIEGFTVQIDNTTGVNNNVTNAVLLQTTSSSITGSPSYTDLLGNQTQPVTPLCNGAPCTAANPQFTTFAAGELHVGEFGKNQFAILVTQTHTATTYAAGTAIGGKITLAGLVRTSAAVGQPGTSGQILSTLVNFPDAVGSGPVDVYYFDNDPTALTCTSASPFALSNADKGKLIGIAHVTDFTASPTVTIGQLGGFPMPYSISAGTTGYACIVARGSITLATANAVSLNVRVLRQ